MSDVILQARDVVRDFPKGRALDRVTLEARAGEVMALLGRNGAGKTTLLRLAFGVMRPTSGSIMVRGVRAQVRAAWGDNVVAGVGDVWEPPAWASLEMLAALQREAGEFDRGGFAGWCRKRELGLHLLWRELSKGQKRWALCGLAIARRPALLLLDEPADGMDPLARKELYEALREYASRGEAAVVVTTHILADVERAADRVAILDKGKVLIDAELETLREEVLEVEVPGEGAEAFAGEVQVLGRRADGEGERVWVRSADGEAVAELRRRYRTGGVSLDELFAVLTERGVAARSEGVHA